jgi:hypothetical protein
MKRNQKILAVSIVIILLASGTYFVLGPNAAQKVQELSFLSNPTKIVSAWEPYSYRVEASQDVCWSMKSTQAGINISSNGYVFGIFTMTGNVSISINATNHQGLSIFQNFSLLVQENSLGIPVATFAAASDGHYGYISNRDGRMQIALVNSIEAQQLGMIFDLGDLVAGNSGNGMGATIANYTAIKEVYDSTGIPYYTAMGNHDNPKAYNTIFPGSIDYYVQVGNIIWIVLNASSIPVVSLNESQLNFLRETLNSHMDCLAFVMCHEGQKQIHWPSVSSPGEVNDIKFQQIIELNSYHMGGVLVAHAHCAGSTPGNKTYYTYTGTYGSTYQNGFNYSRGYDTFGVFKNTTTSTYMIKVWYEVLQTNSALQSTYLEYTV